MSKYRASIVLSERYFERFSLYLKGCAHAFDWQRARKFILHKTFIGNENGKSSSTETIDWGSDIVDEYVSIWRWRNFSCFMIAFLYVHFSTWHFKSCFNIYCAHIKLCRLVYELHGKSAEKKTPYEYMWKSTPKILHALL